MLDTETHHHTDHIILFYLDDQSFLQTLSSYFTQCFTNSNEALVAFVTNTHRDMLEEKLSAMGENNQRLIIVEATDILAECMENNLPNKDKFNEYMHKIIEKIPAHYSSIRFYGELVNILWEAENFAGAVELESLCNEFAQRHCMPMLCGHKKKPLPSPSERAILHKLCKSHSHTIPDEDYQGSEAQLNTLTALRNRSLTLERITQRAKNLKEFIPVLCHEIRNNLHVASGCAQLLTDKFEDLKPFISERAHGILVSIAEYLDAINATIDAQAQILNTNLDIAKLEEGKLTLDQNKLYLSHILKDLERIFKISANKKGIEFELFLPEADVVVKGDEIRLRQILTNLITNSIKFTDNGHVRVTLTVLRYTASHTDVEIKVDDTGIGLSEDEIKNIGTRFEQANSKIRQQYGGWGIGLHLSIGLTAQMKGKLTIESKKEIGSTFRCVFTFENSMSPDLRIKKIENQLESIPINHIQKKKVLIVDDDPSSRKILANFLKDNYECSYAQNGETAINMYLQEKYDIVLMDMIMNGMGGEEAIKQIRRHDGKVPIISISANTIEDQVSLGINAVLTKPFNKNNVLDTIASCLFSKVTLINTG